ncbi:MULTISPECIES: tetratricopeptide repeat protein [unclassified Peribacillus]|uniref:tetratricopeptide repeat protein n=1 Tax=unclassified Peribacillus TaxID=2675266 RepID=UPI001F4F00D9|nr:MULTISPECIES: hypothetical protein [unclassified Peribacillus]MCK1985993.1 hypothetical protein [Peribacillus sp. Aquil_B1]MCK2011216.1 hypothetical protein [Peribacillus sp. Aquil_B8]
MIFSLKSDFLSTVMHLQHDLNNVTNWSKSVVRTFETHSFDDVPYYQSQLIDETVNFEIARSMNLNLEDVRNLNYESQSPNLKIIKWLISNLSYVTPVQKLNLSFVLSSMGKYHLADNILKNVEFSKLLPKEQAYYYLQSFLLGNRLGTRNFFDEEFSKIKNILENNKLSPSAEMVFVTQVIAWYVKNKSFSVDIYKWFLDRGKLNEKKIKNSKDFHNLLAASNYYRASAMVFMSFNNKEDMRKTMELSYKTADLLEASSELGFIKKTEALKTYYESSSKEFAYYHKDLETSIKYLDSMEEIDSNWNITYQEKGDIYSHFEHKEMAIQEYTKALNLDGPNYIYTLFKRSLLHEELRNYEKALEGYKEIMLLDDLNLSSAINGFNISIKLGKDEKEYFESIIDEFIIKGLINESIKEEVIQHD